MNTCFPSKGETVVFRTADGLFEGVYNGYDKQTHLHVVEVPGVRLGDEKIVEVSIGDLFVSPKEHQDD